MSEEPEKHDDDDPHKARARSDEGVTVVGEDLLRTRKSRSTGYVGEGSGVSWLRALQDELKLEGPHQPPVSEVKNSAQRSSEQKGVTSASITDASFYLDANSVELDVEVDPYGLPSHETAIRLFECYKQTVQKSFPALPPQFEDQVRRYFQAASVGRPFTVPDRWLAILNVVFAISARYSHLVDAEWKGKDRDHVVYVSRSIRLLGSWPFAATPELALIQVVGFTGMKTLSPNYPLCQFRHECPVSANNPQSGLLAFYYQVIGHVSKGWVMIGISIRLALALGLHLRNDDPNIPLHKKEAVLRTWWTLHAIECQLSAITGRPCVLGREDCTISLPQTWSEELRDTNGRVDSFQSSDRSEALLTSGSDRISEKSHRLHSPRSYLDAHLHIGLIMQKLLSALYSPRASHYTWRHVQKDISRLLQELDDWKQGALTHRDPFCARLSSPIEGPGELSLRFYYFSAKILITRPCLCHSGRQTVDQSDASAWFGQRTAETCVEAAIGLAELIPSSDPQSLYKNGPWWSIVHLSE